MVRKKDIDPDRILDAAGRLALQHGAHALTLDMIAAEAGISKGGLTYTFPTKEALLSAVMDRDIVRFRTRLESSYEAQPEVCYSELRAFLEVGRTSHLSAEKKTGPLLAAVMHAPESLKSARSFVTWMLGKFATGTAQGRHARMVFYAAVGVFLLQGFGLLPLPVDERAKLVEDFIDSLNRHAR